MSRYDDEPFILWFTRPTPTWLELTAAARGVAISIAMSMGQSGTITLRKGLASLARLIQIPWETLEPALSELIAAGKLEWDGSRFTLFDPEHADRKRRSSAERMANKRARDAASKPGQPPTRDVSDASDVTPVTGGVCDASDVTSILISSDLISSPIPEEIPSARATTATHNVAVPDPADAEPEWWAGVIATISTGTAVDLPAREAWLRYAGHRASKARPAERRDAVHWLTTVMVKEAREDRSKAAHQRERDALFDQRRAGPAAPSDTQKLTTSEQASLAERFPMVRRQRGAA